MTDPRSMPAWERRFRASLSSLPEWSPRAPDRLVLASNRSGIWQVHAWDRAAGTIRRVTDHPVGVIDGAPTLDGEGVLWFQDETGDESGAWLVQPFHGGEITPFLDGVPHGWNEGLAQAPGLVAVGISDREGFGIFVSIDGGEAREVYRSRESVRIGSVDQGGFLRGGLSADGSLLCLEHAEHGDLIHPALRVIDPVSGATVRELVDPGMSLVAKCWSPVAGDQRLAVEHEREGDQRAAIWDVASGERMDLRVDVEGMVWIQDWWPDGSGLLLVNTTEGRDRLLRYDIATAGLHVMDSEPGTVVKARVRPDGGVWYLHEQGHRQGLVLDEHGHEVMPDASAQRAPAGQPYQSWHFTNPLGQRVHGFYVTPPGEGPFPVLMFVHGGPTYMDWDRWRPEVQAYVDAGFVVGMVNYRGSIGYGRGWRDALIGNIGGPELEDVNAGLQDLVSRGMADPSRAVIGGWSWGGYITLMELGKHPELWACGVAGVPVGDYEAGYEDLSPLLQAYDRALLGGTPHEKPDLMRDRNPINFADRVRAPVLFLIGEHDSRCPYRQAMLYVEKLAARGHPHQVHVFPAGHSSFDVDERVREVDVILDFLARHVPARSVGG